MDTKPCVKCFIFDISDGLSVTFKTDNLCNAIDNFRVIFGFSLLNQVKCIWEK